MADLIGKRREDVLWTKFLTMAQGTRIRIIINDDVLIDRTVPINKRFQARLAIEGEILDN